MIEKKHSLFEIIVGVAAIVACVAALLDIPDIRRWIGLDPANSPETPTPMVSTQASGQPIQTLEASPTLIEKVQTPPVVIQTRDISTAPNPTMSGSVSALVTIANQKCQEFGGTPKPANNITSAQISNWRVGQVDKPTVGRIIYCEIHQIPGYVGFVEGDVIPENAIITADLGSNWDDQYPQSLERLAHEGGGWGVFLTLKSITVQHANDLLNNVGGQYWLVSR